MSASRSKFACLQVYDDSSDEEGSPFATIKQGGKKPTVGGQKKTAQQSKGLIVHAVEKKNKSKKTTKAKVIDPATGFVVQDADENYEQDQKFKDELKRAMQLSSANETSVEENGTGSAIESIDKELRKAAGIAGNGTTSESVLVNMYKAKLLESIEQLNAANAALELSEEKYDKQKGKYRKLVELFKDAELTERAKLVLDLGKALESQRDLSQQLSEAQRELEQTRSKLRMYESRK